MLPARPLVITVADVGDGGRDIKRRHRLRLAAVHVRGCAVVIDALSDPARDGELPDAVKDL